MGKTFQKVFVSNTGRMSITLDKVGDLNVTLYASTVGSKRISLGTLNLRSRNPDNYAPATSPTTSPTHFLAINDETSCWDKTVIAEATRLQQFDDTGGVYINEPFTFAGPLRSTTEYSCSNWTDLFTGGNLNNVKFELTEANGKPFALCDDNLTLTVTPKNLGIYDFVYTATDSSADSPGPKLSYSWR